MAGLGILEMFRWETAEVIIPVSGSELLHPLQIPDHLLTYPCPPEFCSLIRTIMVVKSPRVCLYYHHL